MTNLDLYIRDRYDNYKDIFILFNIELIQKDTELPSLKYRFKFTKLKES